MRQGNASDLSRHLPGHTEAIYVYLCDGRVRLVTNVKEISLTDTHVIFTQEGAEAVAIPRRDIYYCSSQSSEAPPGF